jgi:asparagine synthase (glutamine-hydrolysing)
MCGIAGVISRSAIAESDRAALRTALDAMASRGPDGTGLYEQDHDALSGAGGLYMGMRRLSIIDLNGGWQPLFNEDHSLALIANGEIYNHVELRAELCARGHRFRTDSDCETILHLYEDHGEDCLRFLTGMFAFALWDCRRRKLFLARDRLGEKPLYLYERANQLWFTSELKSLVATGHVAIRLNPRSVDDYLHYGWIPEPDTILEGVRKLPPGEFLRVELDSWHAYLAAMVLEARRCAGDPG